MKRRRFTSEFKREAARMLIIDDLEASKPAGSQSPKEMAEEIE